MAEDYLQKELVKLNKNTLIEEEKKHLTAYRPKYEVAKFISSHVNKYSFIQVDNNFYSVPDSLVDKYVLVKLYPNSLDIYYKNKLIASHQRILDKNKTCIDIKHYLNTFLRKPGALRNSSALNSVPELKELFNTYFKANPKDFINILYNHQDLSIEGIKDYIESEYCINEKSSNSNDWIVAAIEEQLDAIQDLFITGGNNNVH